MCDNISDTADTLSESKSFQAIKKVSIANCSAPTSISSVRFSSVSSINSGKSLKQNASAYSRFTRYVFDHFVWLLLEGLLVRDRLLHTLPQNNAQMRKQNSRDRLQFSSST